MACFDLHKPLYAWLTSMAAFTLVAWLQAHQQLRFHAGICESKAHGSSRLGTGRLQLWLRLRTHSNNSLLTALPPSPSCSPIQKSARIFRMMVSLLCHLPRSLNTFMINSITDGIFRRSLTTCAKCVHMRLLSLAMFSTRLLGSCVSHVVN